MDNDSINQHDKLKIESNVFLDDHFDGKYVPVQVVGYKKSYNERLLDNIGRLEEWIDD